MRAWLSISSPYLMKQRTLMVSYRPTFLSTYPCYTHTGWAPPADGGAPLLEQHLSGGQHRRGVLGQVCGASHPLDVISVYEPPNCSLVFLDRSICYTHAWLDRYMSILRLCFVLAGSPSFFCHMYTTSSTRFVSFISPFTG